MSSRPDGPDSRPVGRRVVVLGRGGAGKSTLAGGLAERAGAPLVELDTLFWRARLQPTPRAEWLAVQQRLAAGDRWVIDGDLGPYDVLAPRLSAADTVLVLDLPLPVCAWRVLRRGREDAAFWRWLLLWRRRSRPHVLSAIARDAPGADVRVLRSRRQVRGLLTGPG